MNKVRNTLEKNDYPKFILDKYIKKRIKTLQIRKTIAQNNINTKNPEIKYSAITYHKNITEQIADIFRKETNTIFAPKTCSTLNKKIFTQIKQEVPNKDKSNVIYKVNCSNCNQNYIGQTKNYLNTRLTTIKMISKMENKKQH